MTTVDELFTAFLLIFALIGGVIAFAAFAGINELGAQLEEEYGLGSVVTTTAEYEYITNDSFTGVVVQGDCVRDPTLTIRNRDGVERVFAFEFLEPVR